MDSPGFCTVMPDLSGISKIGRTNPGDLALVFFGHYHCVFCITFFYLLSFVRGCLHFPLLAEGVLHSGMVVRSRREHSVFLEKTA